MSQARTDAVEAEPRKLPDVFVLGLEKVVPSILLQRPARLRSGSSRCSAVLRRIRSAGLAVGTTSTSRRELHSDSVSKRCCSI